MLATDAVLSCRNGNASTSSVSESRKRELRQKLMGLPWAWEPSFAPDAPPRGNLHQVTRVEDRRVRRQVAFGLAGSLVDPSNRERVFRMMVALAVADGAGDPEVAELDPVREAFAIDDWRANEIVSDLKDERV